MMLMILKKYFSSSLLVAALVLLRPLGAEAKDESLNFADDSVKDISIVLGAGVVGAVLGLSTLSFVEDPSVHTKNIAVGGAIGIILGVGVVVFSQATKTTSVIGNRAQVPMNPLKFETLARHEFSNSKIIAQKNLSIPNVGYNFSF